MDATARALLQLCLGRADLLRRALEALAPATSAPKTYGHAAGERMDKVDSLLNFIEGDIKSQKEGADGQHGD